MPSPFPGMNPYLERPAGWRAFHSRFLVFLQDALTPLVGPRYYVELEESLYIDPDGDDRHLFAVADAAVSPDYRNGTPAAAVAVEAAPVTVTIPGAARKRARRLAIYDSQSREVVTVIEVLSPSNKAPGADRERYTSKRVKVLRSRANFVELDLLRGGRRMPLRGLPACDYYALVSRVDDRPRVGLWPVGLRDPLPAIPVPLRAGEPEPTVGLKPVLDRVYDGAGYATRIYAAEPDPPLGADDAAWARGVLAAAGITTEGSGPQ